MQIKRGSTRVAVIFFGLVFKFPTLKQRTVHGRLFHYLRGVIANVSEFATYICCDRASFFVPVFSLGFVSIQKYEGGEKPTWDDLEDVARRLPEKAYRAIKYVDPHHFAPDNFRCNSKGMRMIDFGDSYGDPAPLSNFLLRFHEEFGAALREAKMTLDGVTNE